MHVVNPVLPAFYPDPSLCRVGEDYYLVTSTFRIFPACRYCQPRAGGLAADRALPDPGSQFPLAGVPSPRGIYAPTLRYHAGRFYMMTTNVWRRRPLLRAHRFIIWPASGRRQSN